MGSTGFPVEPIVLYGTAWASVNHLHACHNIVSGDPKNNVVG